MAQSIVESIEHMEYLDFEPLKYLPGAVVRKDGGASIVRTGVKADLFNSVFKIRWSENEAEGSIDRYIEEFGLQNLPFIVHVSDFSSPKNLVEIFKSRGFESQDARTMFALDLGAVPDFGALPSQYTLKRLSDRSDIDRYVSTFVTGFELPLAIAEAFRVCYANYGFGDGKNMRTLILSEGPLPLAIVSILGNRDALVSGAMKDCLPIYAR